MRPEKGDIFVIQKQFIKDYFKDNLADRIQKFLGMIEDEKSNKLSQKQVAINKKKRRDFDIHKNQETRQIQRSRYLAFDQEFFQVEAMENLPKLMNTGFTQIKTNFDSGNSVNIKYMKASDVKQDRQKVMMGKAKFMTKMYQLRKKGHVLELSKMVDEWL